MLLSIQFKRISCDYPIFTYDVETNAVTRPILFAITNSNIIDLAIFKTFMSRTDMSEGSLLACEMVFSITLTLLNFYSCLNFSYVEFNDSNNDIYTDNYESLESQRFDLRSDNIKNYENSHIFKLARYLLFEENYNIDHQVSEKHSKKNIFDISNKGKLYFMFLASFPLAIFSMSKIIDFIDGPRPELSNCNDIDNVLWPIATYNSYCKDIVFPDGRNCMKCDLDSRSLFLSGLIMGLFYMAVLSVIPGYFREKSEKHAEFVLSILNDRNNDADKAFREKNASGLAASFISPMTQYNLTKIITASYYMLSQTIYNLFDSIIEHNTGHDIRLRYWITPIPYISYILLKVMAGLKTDLSFNSKMSFTSKYGTVSHQDLKCFPKIDEIKDDYELLHDDSASQFVFIRALKYSLNLNDLNFLILDTEFLGINNRLRDFFTRYFSHDNHSLNYKSIVIFQSFRLMLLNYPIFFIASESIKQSNIEDPENKTDIMFTVFAFSFFAFYVLNQYEKSRINNKYSLR